VLETCKRAGRSGLEFVSQTLRAFANPLLPRPIPPLSRNENEQFGEFGRNKIEQS
jgi:hypothetical protein